MAARCAKVKTYTSMLGMARGIGSAEAHATYGVNNDREEIAFAVKNGGGFWREGMLLDEERFCEVAHLRNARITQSIMNRRSVATSEHDPSFAEFAEVLRDVSLTNAEHGRHLRDGQFTVVE